MINAAKQGYIDSSNLVNYVPYSNTEILVFVSTQSPTQLNRNFHVSKRKITFTSNKVNKIIVKLNYMGA